MPDATDGLPLPLACDLCPPKATPSLGNTYLFNAIAEATFIPADLKSFCPSKTEPTAIIERGNLISLIVGLVV